MMHHSPTDANVDKKQFGYFTGNFEFSVALASSTSLLEELQ